MIRKKKKLDKNGKKVLTLTGLKDEMDRLFSLYVRQSLADENGDAKCVTCGKIMNWRYIQCGHYVSRGELPLRFELKNVSTQCGGCNKWRGGDITFALHLQKKYGNDILEWLEIKKHNTMKMDRFAYEQLIIEYTNKIKAIGGELR